MADLMVEVSETPRRVFERIVVRRNSLRGAGKRCGRSNMWIWRQLRQNKSVDLVKTGKVMAQLDVPMRFFYEEMLDESPVYDPIWVLEHYREGNDLPRDPFLAAVHDRLLALLDLSLIPGGHRRRSVIDALEEVRYFDRPAAKRGLEELGHKLLAAAEASGPNRKVLADCAHLLLVWGSVQRARGHRDDSTDAYRLAYRLALVGGDVKVVGIFHYFSSNLLLELGQPAKGLRFAEYACAIFQQLRDRDLLAQGLVQKSIALRDLRHLDQSRIQAIAALRLAPRNAWRTRAAAWNHLGNLAQARGKALKALGRFTRAKKLCRGSNYLQAFVIWREATILGQLGRPVQSATSFRKAIRLFGQFGQPLDVAFVGVDLAEMLMEAGRFSEALTIAKMLTPWFEKLGANAQALGLWLDLMALILQGSRASSLAQVEVVREALRTADPKIRLQLHS